MPLELPLFQRSCRLRRGYYSGCATNWTTPTLRHLAIMASARTCAPAKQLFSGFRLSQRVQQQQPCLARSMATTTTTAVLNDNSEIYSPRKVLDHPSFRVLAADEAPPSDANIAAFYNPKHEVHLVVKPRPKPGPGQVLVHVRATGICG